MVLGPWVRGMIQILLSSGLAAVPLPEFCPVGSSAQGLVGIHSGWLKVLLCEAYSALKKARASSTEHVGWILLKSEQSVSMAI